MTEPPATIEVTARWDALFEAPTLAELERALARYVAERRWFRAKSQRVEAARVVAALGLPHGQTRSRVALVEVHLEGGGRDTYVVPLAFVTGEEGRALAARRPHALVASASVVEGAERREGALVDALSHEPFLAELLDALAAGARVEQDGVTLRFHPLSGLGDARGAALAARLVDREQTNTSVLYGDRFVGKIVRKVDPGASPDLDMGRFLTEVRFTGAPALAGWLDLSLPGQEAATIGLFYDLVKNEGDAWMHALSSLASLLDRARGEAPRAGGRDVLERADGALDDGAVRAVGGYAPLARLLGQRVGEMHAALVSRPDDATFAPEPLDAATRVTLGRAAEEDMAAVLAALEGRRADLDDDAHAAMRIVAEGRGALERRVRRFVDLREPGVVTRVHGDLHLGQVLFTGDDFAIIDFEGEPARPLHERRAKRSPVVDVAGMLRSYHYAAVSALRARAPEERERLAPWAELFHEVAAASFLAGWLGAVADTTVLPPRASLGVLLDFFLLEKCLYEVRYEMNNRPDWIAIPLSGLGALARSSDG